MTDQLHLVEIAPKLTDRQQRALEHLTHASRDGLHADELGALMHASRHGWDERCQWCGSTGNELLRALRRKGLARYKRGTAELPGYWLAAADAAETAVERPSGMLPDSEPLPF